VPDHDPEIEYLRAVEELFTTLRGVPHTLSPKDVQLAREWWKDEVPLAAVGAGVGEVLDRKRQAGELDPVVSLSYCRHAVRRAARRLAERRIGLTSSISEDSGGAVEASVASLRAALIEAASGCRSKHPGAAEVIETIADQIGSASGLAPAELDEHLFTLEAALLEGCHKNLTAAARSLIETDAERAIAATGRHGAAANRAAKALRDRAVRTLLGLPRLEIS